MYVWYQYNVLSFNPIVISLFSWPTLVIVYKTGRLFWVTFIVVNGASCPKSTWMIYLFGLDAQSVILILPCYLFVITMIQVWSFNRYLRDGLLCCAGAPWLPCRPSSQVQVSCWDPAQGHKGWCHEMVPGQIWGCDPQQVSEYHRLIGMEDFDLGCYVDQCSLLLLSFFFQFWESLG